MVASIGRPSLPLTHWTASSANMLTWNAKCAPSVRDSHMSRLAPAPQLTWLLTWTGTKPRLRKYYDDRHEQQDAAIAKVKTLAHKAHARADSLLAEMTNKETQVRLNKLETSEKAALRRSHRASRGAGGGTGPC